MGFQRTPTVSVEDVERIALRDFPSESGRVMEILRKYGTEDWHRETDRVRLAALKLASGNIDRLCSTIETAKCDYRDVLAPAQYSEYSRIVGPSEAVSPAEWERIIDADWKQYVEWLAR
ncbi:MAG: hypothetical protein R3284_06075 [Rubricoccaceae bacterium]|nr:hypothetical protein [Rubricoccaceae bacterium]